ncbi:unnamed protein product [Arabis nemorensis]|uniref:Uncharacterized protein n=1 Tax=Arabis nemorensis TaxID=586526 RepID=A0A565CJC3_9BRAS|nr:unnamed protein product [Arabis nemorensis]
MTQRDATLGVLMDATMAEAVPANLFLMEHTNATVSVNVVLKKEAYDRDTLDTSSCSQPQTKTNKIFFLFSSLATPLEKKKIMLLLQPPLVSTRFHSLYFITRRPFPFVRPPISATAFSAFPSSSSSSPSSISSWNNLDSREEEEDDDESLPSRRYDFSPLLQYLSRFGSIELVLEESDSVTSPKSLDPAEFHLAESYKAVPAPYWHSLLKSLY